MSVVSSRKGSRTPLSVSGMSTMSDSWMPLHPAIDDPSNILPSSKKSSSTCDAGTDTCCSLPLVSVKRRSTNLTSCSSIKVSAPSTDMDGGLLWTETGLSRVRNDFVGAGTRTGQDSRPSYHRRTAAHESGLHDSAGPTPAHRLSERAARRLPGKAVILCRSRFLRTPGARPPRRNPSRAPGRRRASAAPRPLPPGAARAATPARGESGCPGSAT